MNNLEQTWNDVLSHDDREGIALIAGFGSSVAWSIADCHWHEVTTLQQAKLASVGWDYYRRPEPETT